jgi:hypothetical protein
VCTSAQRHTAGFSYALAKARTRAAQVPRVCWPGVREQVKVLDVLASAEVALSRVYTAMVEFSELDPTQLPYLPGREPRRSKSREKGKGKGKGKDKNPGQLTGRSTASGAAAKSGAATAR